jgi:glutamate synthase (NADPH/NADH) small chain
MIDNKGFLKYEREAPPKEKSEDRTLHYKEFISDMKKSQAKEQSARCMDCGIPFCHNGCPLGNVIPDFNKAVEEARWKDAFEILSSTNNFPEFTGRICPAPCETACVLGLHADPVSIEQIERKIIEIAFKNQWVKAIKPTHKTNQRIAIIGSGPAGLAAADQLNKMGHDVVVYEKNAKPGGLLRYGIPDFKLEKTVIDRRLNIMKKSGVEFICNAHVGVDVSVQEMKEQYDVILLTGGSEHPRDLNLPGRELSGIHFAMDFLKQSNQYVSDETGGTFPIINAKGKNVVVIGGGDTGADCVGTSNRQGAKSVTQIELLSKPPESRDESTPWPLWPMQLRTSSSHEEGCDRQWALMTTRFNEDDNGNVKSLTVSDVSVDRDPESGRFQIAKIEGTEKEVPCELVLIAAGFLHPLHEGLLSELGVTLNQNGTVHDRGYQTSEENIFVAGDMRRGQSLVVWAIAEGRDAAKEIDKYLQGKSKLPSILDSQLALV